MSRLIFKKSSLTVQIRQLALSFKIDVLYSIKNWVFFAGEIYITLNNCTN